MTNEQAIILFNRYLEDSITPEEYIRLRQWSADDRNEGVLDELVARALIDLPERGMADIDLDAVYAALLQEKDAAPVHRIHFLRTAWLRYAAVLLLLLGTGVYFWNRQLTIDNGQLTIEGTGKNDIAPGRDGAILTLADGTQLVLDSLGNGVVATQNGARVLLQNGQLAYDLTGKAAGEIQYNTMTTPKGRQFSVVLPDGTRVWLNAASSLRYPTAFNGKERQVMITGEAYFEVAKDKAKPFFVKINNEATVEVLGTSFNVYAYEDEASINTTLIEGSVVVSYNRQQEGLTDQQTQLGRDGDQPVILKPGQQAQIVLPAVVVSSGRQPSSSPKMKVINNADIDKVMAWKNGLFNFEGASLREVMQQLERWYDIEVVYMTDIPPITFWGKISRNVTLQGVLRGLEAAEVHFRMEEGRRLVVMR